MIGKMLEAFFTGVTVGLTFGLIEVFSVWIRSML